MVHNTYVVALQWRGAAECNREGSMSRRLLSTPSVNVVGLEGLWVPAWPPLTLVQVQELLTRLLWLP